MRSRAFHRISSRLFPLLPLGTEQDPYAVQAIVLDLIMPRCTGYIKFKGSLWRALCKQNVPLLPGTVVRVLDRRGLTLLVEPIAYPVVR
ncbi:MAG: NfeD family protein [Oculatellaceae cyanobacterium Prado106]|jgi:membrane protein implicated in regulation of membrane protease activity|nr:NfeD family protein [Oculatellaceae cyanobacterium Prado106]